MTLTIELTQEQEAKITRRAASYGLSPEAYVKQWIEFQSAQPGDFHTNLTSSEWVSAFQDWIDSQPKNMPALTEEDISRESIYGDSR